MGISTHILDTSLGRPVPNVTLTLFELRYEPTDEGWYEVGTSRTDSDGRCKDLLGSNPLRSTAYKLRFAVSEYFHAQKLPGIYPFIEVVFTVVDASQHYHIPLLLTANSYTTYRGS